MTVVRRFRRKFGLLPRIASVNTSPRGRQLSKPILMKMHDGKDQIASAIYARGWCYEASQFRLFEQALLCWEHGSFVDVGSNTGVYSLLAASISDRPIFAFEPVPFIYSYCAENFELNIQTKGVALSPIAISNQKGLASIFIPDKDHGLIETSATLGPKVHGNVLQTIQVETDTLDSVLSGSMIAVLKIDVEGFEQEVIEGALETLRRCRPIVFCEILAPFHEALGTIPQMLSSVGYERAAITGNGLRFESGHCHDPQIWDYLLYPKEKGAVIAALAS